MTLMNLLHVSLRTAPAGVHRCCFLANARQCGFHEFMRLSMLDDGTWLNKDGELHLLLVMDLLDNQVRPDHLIVSLHAEMCTARHHAGCCMHMHPCATT